ncbi:AAA family ATPase [Sulfitobacter sp. 1A13353]|jgi:predicted kinase|uniref:AAA family ATPase n=1 Tax=Sulfitobacter sp. 1A13353 TaxID=3368568 RepID=UPI0037451A1B
MADWLNMILEDRVDPETFHLAFPWAEEMICCPHDSLHHAEGDPWVHTKLVVSELVNSEAYLALPDDRQAILRLAAWFHDVAKPATTEISWLSYLSAPKDDDEIYRPTSWTPKSPQGAFPTVPLEDRMGRVRVRQPGHAPLGASMAYQALIDAGAEARDAREVHAHVFWHQRPFFLMSENNRLQRAIRFSHEIDRGNWHELLTLCRADNRGRVSMNAQETLEGFDYLELGLEEMGENIGCNLVHEPWPFESEEARLKYLRGKHDGSAFFMPENPNGSRMIMISGLPGAGKDTLIATHYGDLPVVSLDDIRGQMDVGWKDNQGQVLQAGFEAARVHMRAGQDFVWNATCLSRTVRQKILGLARDYDCMIEGVSLDIPLNVAKARNRGRDRAVPDHVMDKLARKRDPILRDEVHRLWSADAEHRLTPLFGVPQEEPAVELSA